MSASLVHRFLEESARRAPDATALIEPDRTITYGELEQLSNRIGNLLIASGVRRGDRVVIALDNCIELVAAYVGTLKAGAIAVPLPSGPRNNRLGIAVADCTPAAAIVDSTTAHDIGPNHALASVPVVFVATSAARPLPVEAGVRELRPALEACSATPPAVRIVDIDLAAIIYTSGSTGEPRGVMLSHRNIVANTRSIVQYLELTARDRVMCVLPFYYVYGLSLLHTHLAVGGSVVIDNRFAFPNVVLKSMHDHQVTGFAGVPSTFAFLLHRSELASLDQPRLRYVTQAGGGMAPAMILKWLERGWQVPFFVMYGATEGAARLTCLDPARLHAKLGSIGRPIPNVEILVVREDGSLAEPGEVGELVARGSNIAKGYWNDPDGTAERFGPLGYRTGDLGYTDADGFLFLVGRLHDMIKVGAHRVGAKEIEEVLYTFPGMLEAAVVAAPHELLGETPVAFVSVEYNVRIDTESLRAFCRSRLPAHKVPTQLLILPELPKLGEAGKIDKTNLRAMARRTSNSVA